MSQIFSAVSPPSRLEPTLTAENSTAPTDFLEYLRRQWPREGGWPAGSVNGRRIAVGLQLDEAQIHQGIRILRIKLERFFELQRSAGLDQNAIQAKKSNSLEMSHIATDQFQIVIDSCGGDL